MRGPIALSTLGHGLSVFTLIFVALASLCLVGCGSTQSTPEHESARFPDIDQVLIVPFKSVTHSRKIDTTVRCPICGAVFQTGPIEAGADKYMTRQLVAFMKGKTPYELILPDMAEGVRSEILAEDIGMSQRRLIVEMGKRLRADAVICGTIFRFRQRVGTALSVETPASVAFGIHLIRVGDGRLIWVRRFDETQRSLSEDLFKLRTFVRRGGGWLTAEELAIFALHEAMASFPVE
jgi:hypothetical protein